MPSQQNSAQSWRKRVLEKRVDGDQLLDWLNSIEAPAEEPIATDVLCKHSDLFLPYLDRVSWDRLCITNSQIYNCSRSVTPPWPQKLLHMGSKVNSVAFSMDGEYLACGSDDGMVRLWNVRNGNCTLLEGHTEFVGCVSFSPNGKLLASGSGDYSIRLWKLDDQSHRLLEGHNGGITSIAFSPSGSSLASGSIDNGKVRWWNIDDGRCIRTFTSGSRFVWSVAFSPDGANLAAGGGSIYLWDLEANDDSSSPSSTIETNGLYASCLVYSPDGIFRVSYLCDSIKTWRVSDGSVVKTLGGDLNVYACSVSPNGKHSIW